MFIRVISSILIMSLSIAYSDEKIKHSDYQNEKYQADFLNKNFGINELHINDPDVLLATHYLALYLIPETCSYPTIQEYYIGRENELEKEIVFKWLEEGCYSGTGTYGVTSVTLPGYPASIKEIVTKDFFQNNSKIAYSQLSEVIQVTPDHYIVKAGDWDENADSKFPNLLVTYEVKRNDDQWNTKEIGRMDYK